VRPGPAANLQGGQSHGQQPIGNSRSCLGLNTPLRLSSPTVRCDSKEKASADAVSPVGTCMGWGEFQNRPSRVLAAWTRLLLLSAPPLLVSVASLERSREHPWRSGRVSTLVDKRRLCGRLRGDQFETSERFCCGPRRPLLPALNTPHSPHRR
jgi:hypothetical protein